MCLACDPIGPSYQIGTYTIVQIFVLLILQCYTITHQNVVILVQILGIIYQGIRLPDYLASKAKFPLFAAQNAAFNNIGRIYPLQWNI